MALFLLVRCASGHGLAPGFQHLLPITGMKHALPPVPLYFFQREAGVGAPLRVAEIKRAIGWTAPDLLRDCVNDEAQVVFTSPHFLFCPLTLGNFLSQRLVDSFKLQGSLGDAT